MFLRWFYHPVLALAVFVVLTGCAADSDPGNGSTTTRAEAGANGTEVFGVRVASNGGPRSEVEMITEMLGALLDDDGNERADAVAVESELLADSVTIVATPSDGFSAEYDPTSATLALGGVADAERLSVMRHIDALIYRHGWSRVFDDLFGLRVGSDLAHAMDQARGGRFDAVPETYPAGASYTQSREGCAYRCQLIEYFFHVHMTLLGEYEDDAACLALRGVWQSCTAEALRARDPLAYEAFTEQRAGLVDVER